MPSLVCSGTGQDEGHFRRIQCSERATRQAGLGNLGYVLISDRYLDYALVALSSIGCCGQYPNREEAASTYPWCLAPGEPVTALGRQETHAPALVKPQGDTQSLASEKNEHLRQQAVLRGPVRSKHWRCQSVSYTHLTLPTKRIV